MSHKSEPLLSVEEVLELVPGDADNATWVNPGMKAVVRAIKNTKTQKGGIMNICTLGSETGSAEISLSVFAAIKFSEGDVIAIEGGGLRRTEYKGLQQVSLGKATEIHIVGKSVHAEEQQQRKAAGAPAINGAPQPIAGQSVGCALNQAVENHRYIYTAAELREMLKRPGLYWQSIHEMASDQLRVARHLEHGKLAPSIKEREGRATAPAAGNVSAPPPARTPAKSPQPGPEGSVALDDQEEDPPF